MRRPIKRTTVFVLAIVVMLALFFASFMIGQYPMGPTEVVKAIGSKIFGWDFGLSEMAQTIVWKVRLPRILAALLVGAALSVAGAVYQGLFRNPMVSPDILGASSGAGFGAALAILLSFSYALIQVNAFVFGIMAVGIAYFLCQRVSQGKDALLMLVLTGMIVSTLFSSFITLTKFVADPDSKLPEITYWLMGSLATITLDDIAFLIPPLLIGFIPLFSLRWQINAMAFGDEEAQAMGLNVKRLRFLFIVTSTLLTSAAVAVSGIIGWVGLVVPHMVRFMVGPNYRDLLPMSFIVGGTFLLAVDDIARTLFTSEIPLGILTSIIGAPFFFYLLLKRKKASQ